MLDRLISWLERKLKQYQLHHKRERAEVVADARAEGVVLRFQGRYDCGHPWPLDKLAPEFCPIHGEGCERVYAPAERLNFSKVGTTRIPNS